MEDIERSLRPGGLVLFMDGETDVYDENQVDTLPSASEQNPGGSWLKKIFRGTFFTFDFLGRRR